MTNITTLSYENEFVASTECFNWCKEQVSIFESNTTIEGFTILVVAMIALFIYTSYINFGDMIESTYESKQRLDTIMGLMPNLALYLIIGFVVNFIWFT